MKKRITLSALKQSFVTALPGEDGRTRLSPCQFVSGLVFCFLSDTKSYSLESIRRFLIGQFAISLSRGAFWERLAGRRLEQQLLAVLGELMKRVCAVSLLDAELPRRLGVKSVVLLDSSSMTLWDGSRSRYPGTWTTAAMKWHVCWDVLAARVQDFALSAGATHDRHVFPELSSLIGQLIVFDLGYWDYGLFAQLEAAKVRFLSRVKTNAALVITDVVSGLGKRHRGRKLSTLRFQRRGPALVEALAALPGDPDGPTFRLIGVWNPTDKKYHWYLTNLTVAADVLYPLYRIRWQLELLFKACKRSFNVDKRLTSNNDRILRALVLSSLIASFVVHLVHHLGSRVLSMTQQLAISVQRVAHVVVQLATDFIAFLNQPGRRAMKTLLEKIAVFAPELVEKNHRHRPTSLQQLHTQLLA